MRPSSVRKREAALVAAERQFLTTGYESVTMDSIAAESGVAKQTLYSYFGSKRALFLELVLARTVHAADHVHGPPIVLDERSDPRAVLGELLEGQLRTVLDPTLLALRRLVIAEANRSPELAAILYEHGPERAIRSIAQTLERFIALGILRVANPELAATQLNWLVMGEPINRAMLLGPGSAEMSDDAIAAHVDRALDTFLAAADPSLRR
ncbi:TetR/AcrR family transcriptional regulator [Agromyces silvae]|uniref:TetR/AcrR family transcriptional regulator n=1 Tax=Agromyces silvae TaxID=3388266 RepID=UPI00280A9641|nr:TetR/AcrR family transcriptional regulator [Agromyces protaetiae]